MQRSKLIAIAAALLVALAAVAAFLTWQHVTRLNEQLTDLSRQMSALQSQVAASESFAREAKTRAEQARDRAEQAQAKAERAHEAASEAAQRATEAMAREQQSTEKAKEAEAARQKAEEEQLLADMARSEAERLAEQARQVRLMAEESRAVAEQKQQEAQAEARQARAETKVVRRQLERELDRMQRSLGKIADTRRDAMGLVMTLDAKQIEFDFNKAELRPRNREVLSRIAGVLLTFDNYGIQVFGHTDDVGTVEYNQSLSDQRAEAVGDYLVEAGIDSTILATMGLGKSSPLVEGTDPESRQRNRRVELAIVFSEGEFGPAVTEE